MLSAKWKKLTGHDAQQYALVGLPSVKHAKGHLGHQPDVVMTLKAQPKVLQALCDNLRICPVIRYCLHCGSLHAPNHMSLTGSDMHCRRDSMIDM